MGNCECNENQRKKEKVIELEIDKAKFSSPR